MKKTVASILTSTLLLTALNGCVQASGHTYGENAHESMTQKDEVGKAIEYATDDNYTSALPPLSKMNQKQRYEYFHDNINQNVYDKWLIAEQAEGVRSEKEIYAEYLAFWKNEFAFTIESGKDLFKDTNEYNAWKNELEQWLESAQETLKIEIDILGSAEVQQLEVIVPHCKLIRQKVIDTKYFLYQCQFECYSNIEIMIEWAPESKLIQIN